MFELLFEKRKETAGTWVYDERLEDELDTPVVGTLYVKKHAVKTLGSPERLIVTIKEAK